jgi:basic membrane lipoprotein Med (substrate-binding protein (PBP1-ABC) superfamily)
MFNDRGKRTDSESKSKLILKRVTTTTSSFAHCGRLLSTYSLTSLANSIKQAPPKICMVLDKGGKDDHSFNESAVNGFNKSLKELAISKDSKFVEPRNDAQIPTFFRNFATSMNCDLIIAIGFNPSDSVPELALKYPNKKIHRRSFNFILRIIKLFQEIIIKFV